MCTTSSSSIPFEGRSTSSSNTSNNNNNNDNVVDMDDDTNNSNNNNNNLNYDSNIKLLSEKSTKMQLQLEEISSSSSSSSYSTPVTMLWCLSFLCNILFLLHFHCYNNNNNTTNSITFDIITRLLFSTITDHNNEEDILLQKSLWNDRIQYFFHIHNNNNNNDNTTYVHDDDDITTTTLLSSSSINVSNNYDYSINIDRIIFTIIVMLSFEILNYISTQIEWFPTYISTIPVRGKHLDTFRYIDIGCVVLNQCNTGPFTYYYLRYCFMCPTITVWSPTILSIPGTIYYIFQSIIIPLIILFILFDLLYSTFHYILHFQYLYVYIHKHHHIQKAPSRGNVDAINVHPIEFVVGEYNHLIALYIVTQYIQQQQSSSSTTMIITTIPIITPILFLVLGGISAGFNHTRYDISLSVPILNLLNLGRYILHGHRTTVSNTTTTTTNTKSNDQSNNYPLQLLHYIPIYDSKYHDVHHRIPQSNYGQYTMIWDYILFSSIRSYNPNDRINLEAQLDPKTGKSISHTTATNSNSSSKHKKL